MTESHSLTEAEIEFYQGHGFLLIEDVLSTMELDDLRLALAAAMEAFADHSGNSHGTMNQRINLWCYYEEVRRFAHYGKLAEIARRLSGSKRIRLWHDQVLVKPSLSNRATPWHQDLPYWPMNESNVLSCWIALDDIDERNGCMQFIPGSHRWGYLPLSFAGSYAELLARYSASYSLTPVTVPVRAGSCTFHHGLTLHYAFANRTTQDRRVFKIVYMEDGVTYSPKHHCLTASLNLKPGQRLAGEQFPVLAEAASD
jgi:ectoine hydroxylase-related dioxygenase (phytanoyl-CoA dioxygenase family)